MYISRALYGRQFIWGELILRIGKQEHTVSLVIYRPIDGAYLIVSFILKMLYVGSTFLALQNMFI
jgi:hypothetical protein